MGWHNTMLHAVTSFVQNLAAFVACDLPDHVVVPCNACGNT